ncbi:putative cytochrome P450 [Sclerotinia borealis F-4128]|uniref:Putative cytochrome P450 n=1 Tax=Sclerotinia borealis (strain F-4128) TaxID=1432307 RepID=W9CN42_SCLBF|nr:putative cytochrome P450 [Sclerotinia borealis F-4128]
MYFLPLFPAFLIVTIGIALYAIGLVAHRFFFAPLTGFPGPTLAAVTGWYEFYYDYWFNGQYIFKIEEMHKKYGPIVRINPEELSIHDPEFYNEIYVTESKRRTNNYDVFCKGIDFDGDSYHPSVLNISLTHVITGSHLLTTDHDLHRRRRKPLEPFFSRMGISRLQPMLAEVVRKLEQRLMEYRGTDQVIRLDHAFSSFSGDIIGKICWEDEKEFLDDPDFAPEWYNVIHTIVRSIPLFTGFPSLVQMLGYIPESVLLWAFPQGQSFTRFKTIAHQHILKAKLEKSFTKSKSTSVNEHVSLFRFIVNSDMPESELSDGRLAKEAQVVLGGGTASTAHTLGFVSYYILSNKHIQTRLQGELREVMVGWPLKVPSWADLERVQYLQTLIKEGLRLSYGVMHRLPRVSPDLPIQYKQWTIPPGAPVGMSAYLMHSDKNVYPKPSEFIPERWLGDVNPAMYRSYVPFCRGSRNCLGMNLAQAEMSLAIAVLFRPGGPNLKLYDTTERDVKQVHDFLIPLPDVRSKGMTNLYHASRAIGEPADVS